MDTATPVVFVISYKKRKNLRKIIPYLPWTAVLCDLPSSTRLISFILYYFVKTEIKNIVIFNMSSCPNQITFSRGANMYVLIELLLFVKS